MIYFRLLVFVLFVLVASGCKTAPDRCNIVLPVFILEHEPLYTGEISLDSNDAAIRYMAMRSDLVAEISPDTHDVQIDRWDQFIALDWDDTEDTASYISYLEERQWLFKNAYQTSLLGKFGEYGLPIGYYEGPKPEGDPRRELFKTMRLLTIALADDAHRHWIDGRHTLAIDRVQTILRMARQIQYKEDYTHIDGIVAIAIMHVGIDRLDRMARSELFQPEDTQAFLDTTTIINGDDPLAIYCERTRAIGSYQAWLEAQLVPEDGTQELWAYIARYLGAEELASFFFRDLVTVSIETGEVVEPRLDQDEILEQFLADLDGIEIQTIRDQYIELKPLVQIVIQELSSGSPNLAVIQSITELTEDDPFVVSDLLGLSTLHSVLRRYQSIMDFQDRITPYLRSQ